MNAVEKKRNPKNSTNALDLDSHIGLRNVNIASGVDRTNKQHRFVYGDDGGDDFVNHVHDRAVSTHSVCCDCGSKGNRCVCIQVCVGVASIGLEQVLARDE